MGGHPSLPICLRYQRSRGPLFTSLYDISKKEGSVLKKGPLTGGDPFLPLMTVDSPNPVHTYKGIGGPLM